MTMLEQAIQTFVSHHNYPNFSPKAFFFDMDGVLFDSMKRHAPAWVQAFKDYGFDFLEYDAYRNEGRTGRNTVDLMYQKVHGRPATFEEKEQVYQAKSKYFHSYGQPDIIPNVDKVLKKLHDESKQIFVVTGSAERSLFKAIDHFFPNIFSPDKMVTAYDVKYGKPHPEPYLIALEKSEVNPWEGVVIENAPLGAQSGRASGMFTIVINTGILDNDELLESGAHIVLPDMQALYDLLPLLKS